MRGLLVAVVGLALFGLLVVFAFSRGLIGPGETARPLTEVSPAAAASAEDKLRRLQEGGEEARFSGAEITSLLRYHPELWSFEGLQSPDVWMEGDTLRIRGAVPTDQLPNEPEIEALRFFLPDTAHVEVSGTVRPLEPGTSVIDIASIEISGMPIPSRYYPLIVNRIGGGEPNGLSSAAYPLPLPAGIGSARVQAGELILTP